MSASPPALRALALAPYPETAPSSRFRVVQFAPALAALGVHLDFRPFLGAGEYAAARRGGAEAVAALAGAAARFVGTLRGARRYDVVLVQRGMALLGDQVLAQSLHRWGIPLVYDFDDAVYLPQEEGRGWLERLRDPEGTTRALCRRASVVLAGNETLATFARGAVGPGRAEAVRVLPSVVDTDRFHPRPAEDPDGVPVLGWVGSDSTVGYLETLAPALREVAERTPHRLRVVSGARRPRLDGISHEFVPWTPEAEARTLQGLDVGLYPLPDTPWSRGKCGFKALQYLACGVPCVASPVGVLRDIVLPGSTGLHADTTEDWVEGCVRLLGDAAARGRMGLEGRARVEERYSLRMAAPLLARALRDAADGGA